MKKNIALVLSCAVAVLGLASCNKETDQPATNGKKHTVIFQAHNPAASETKTALHLQVIPDWRNTDPEDVHIFETETTSGGSYRMEASKVYMDINEDYTDARFTAEFDNATVIVNPPTTKASSSEFKYTAIMATRDGDKYIVPSVQYPDEESWIDPKADVLVGRTDNTYSATLHEKEIQDLNFRRPVALARLAITNLEGSTVTKVKITTANHITGYVTYDQVNFDKKTIEEFDGDDSNKELTILYPAGKNRTTTFYAYFVSVPGAIQFSKIEVYTDKYVFTKTYANSVSISLPAGEFINLPMDMTVKEGGNVTRTGLNQQTLTFVDANQQEVTEPIEYDLNLSVNPDGKDGFVAPTLVIGDDVVDPTSVTIASNNEEVATVDAEGKASLTGATGEATITATVPGDETHAEGYASYKIIVTDSTAPATVTFYKAEELVKGQEYIIVSGGKAMTLDGTTLGVTAVTDVDGVIETSATLALWTAAEHVEYYSGTSAAGHYTLKSGDNYLQRHSDNSTQTVAAGEVPDTKKYYVWEYDGTHLYHISSSSNTFYMGYVDDVWKFNYQTPYYTTTLYTTTKPLTKQVISFGEEPVTAKYDLNGSQWTVSVPELTGAQTTVTYESSNTAVATVDATSGDVTIAASAKKGDKATITATAEKTDEYTSATASYTIEIIDSTPVAGTTIKLEPATELVAGNKYILVSNGKVLVRDEESAAAYDFDATNVSVTVPGELAENVAWTLEKKTGSITRNNEYVFSQGTYFFGIAMNTNQTTYTYTVEVSNGREFATNVTIQDHNINLTNNLIYYAGNSSYYYIFYNTTDNKWDNEKVSSSASPATTSQTALYQVKDERTEQTLSFSSNTAVFDKGTNDWTEAVPTLSGAQTNVTFESSNTAIATVTKVNNSTVTVTIDSSAKAGDSVVITANAEGDTSFKPAKATFTVSVTNSNLPTYVKADSMDANGEYIIVSNGFVLKNDNGTVAASAVTENNGVIKYDPAASEIWTASSAGELINNEKYLRLNSSSLAIGSKSGTASNNQWTYDPSTPYLKVSSYYLYYSSSSSKFSVSNLSLTDYPSHIAALYVLDDGQPKKRNLAFSESAVSVNIYGQTAPIEFSGAPKLSGKGLEDVTYSVSENTNIASIDATTGAVTLLGETGTVTITASAGATSDYQAGSASYTLTISNVAEKTYTYTSSLSAGKYLITSAETNQLWLCLFPDVNSEGWSGATNGQSLARKDAGTNTNVNSLTFSDTQSLNSEVELIASGSGYKVKILANDKYLKAPTANYQVEYVDSIDDAGVYTFTSNSMTTPSSGSTPYYFYHSGSAKGFTQRTQSVTKLRFYKANE